MRHIIAGLCVLLWVLGVAVLFFGITGCATMQPQPTTEPDTAVAKYKTVDAYVLIPRKAEDQESTAATITGDGEEVRWIPLKIKVNVPVDEGASPKQDETKE